MRFGDAAARLSSAASVMLGWRPDDFWDATPAELALALHPPGDAAEPLDPAAIEDLKRRFPDETKA